MPSWNDLTEELERQPSDMAKTEWLRDYQRRMLSSISTKRENRNVIFYASAFLTKPLMPPPNLQLTHEELNGFMTCMQGMDWSKGLTLIMHTPGGVINAAETIVGYLHSKFEKIETIIPTFAMSAGTMVCLASDKIIMGRQSQLGPIDPQMNLGGRTVSARAVVDQFERAREELSKDLNQAHLWAPVLQSLGPSVLQEAQNALDYGERLVKDWLETRMFRGQANADELSTSTAAYFNQASLHKSHGKRIDREEARSQNVVIEDLEYDQDFQDFVLTAYHLMTIVFEKSPACKIIASNNHDHMWVKNAAVMSMPGMPLPMPTFPQQR
jgi:ATP-dependent protease ClpP protease subunit